MSIFPESGPISLILSHLPNELGYGPSHTAFSLPRRPSSPGCTPSHQVRVPFAHLCLGRRSLLLGSYMEHRCQKVLAWLNLVCSQKRTPGRTVPCTQRDIHIVQPRVLAHQRWGGLKSGSRCRCTRCLQPRAQVRSSRREGAKI